MSSFNWASLIRRADQMYHFLTKWVHDSIWVGLIISSVSAAMSSFLTNGSTGISPLAKWPLVLFFHDHYWAYVIPVLVSIIYLLFALAHIIYQHPPTGDQLSLQPVNVLTLTMMHLDPRPQAYFRRSTYTDLCHSIEQRMRRQKITPIWLIGPPAIGKTRMIYELLKDPTLAHLFQKALILVTVPATLSATQLAQIKKARHLIVLLDDVQRTPEYLQNLQRILPVLRHHAATKLTILLASRPDDEQELASFIPSFIEMGGVRHTLEPMLVDAPEGTAFVSFIQEQLPLQTIRANEFDGTPGSLIFGLDQRTAELRQMSSSARAVVQTLAVLREATISPLSQERVQRVGNALFALDAQQFATSVLLLERNGWLRSHSSVLEVPADAIFLCLQRVGYPAPGLTVLDDVVKAIPILTSAPIDVDALVQISDMIELRQETFSPDLLTQLNQAQILQRALTGTNGQEQPLKRAALELRCGVAYIEQMNADEAIPLLEAARTTFDRTNHPIDWAAATNNLGNAFRTKQDGDRSDNIEQAITYLEESLDVYQRETFPQQYATTNFDLAILLHARPIGDQQANLKQGIQRLNNAAQVYTRETAPQKWAEIQSNLGTFYRERVRGQRRRNREKEVQAFRKATAVYEEQEQANQRELAHALNNLGNAYRERLQGSQRDNIEIALDCFRRARALQEERSYEWARTANLIGMAYDERLQGTQSENIEQAIIAYGEALSVLTPTDTRHVRVWAWTENNLGRAYQHRLQDHQSANLQVAYTCYQTVAESTIQRIDPTIWAAASFNLGLVCELIARRSLQENKEANGIRYQKEGITAIQDAMEVYTPATEKEMYRQCQNILGRLHQLTTEIAA